jgi:hypothetical protein
LDNQLKAFDEHFKVRRWQGPVTSISDLPFNGFAQLVANESGAAFCTLSVTRRDTRHGVTSAMVSARRWRA